MDQSQSKPEVIVSVCMITYNHEKYIAEAIEGVLMQKSTFSFELVIGEDCSIDKTREICETYQKKFPHIIKLLPKQEKNLGMMANFVNTLKECKGTYIALCEGDDYWTDPFKLQKQVDFLEANTDVSLTCTLKTVLKDGVITKHGAKQSISYANTKNVLTDFIAPTQTMVFRNLKGLSEFLNQHPLIYGGDRAITYYASLHGKIAILPFWGSIYRITKQGVSTGLSSRRKLIVRFQSSIDLHYSLNLGCNYLLIRTQIGSFFSLKLKDKVRLIILIATQQINLRYSLKDYAKVFLKKKMPL